MLTKDADMTAVNRTRYIDGVFIKDYHTITGTKRGGWTYNRLGTRRLGYLEKRG
jgi:hypothetical protein